VGGSSGITSKRVSNIKPVLNMTAKITAILEAEKAEKQRRMSVGRVRRGSLQATSKQEAGGIKYFMADNGIIRCDRGQQMEEGDILQFSELEEIVAEFTKEADLCKLFVSWE
jgi:hypothetical protein